MKALLSLGANLGDRGAMLRHACELLGMLPNTIFLRRSSFYQTKAVEVVGSQPDYINCVAEIETDMPPAMLLGACLGIEAACGRVRQGVKSPRTLDIDLLLYQSKDGGFRTSSDPLITLPHPRMLERAFVLIPLRELYPDMIAIGLDFCKAIEKVSQQIIEKIDD